MAKLDRRSLTRILDQRWLNSYLQFALRLDSDAAGNARIARRFFDAYAAANPVGFAPPELLDQSRRKAYRSATQMLKGQPEALARIQLCPWAP